MCLAYFPLHIFVSKMYILFLTPVTKMIEILNDTSNCKYKNMIKMYHLSMFGTVTPCMRQFQCTFSTARTSWSWSHFRVLFVSQKLNKRTTSLAWPVQLYEVERQYLVELSQHSAEQWIRLVDP